LSDNSAVSAHWCHAGYTLSVAAYSGSSTNTPGYYSSPTTYLSCNFDGVQALSWMRCKTLVRSVLAATGAAVPCKQWHAHMNGYWSEAVGAIAIGRKQWTSSRTQVASMYNGGIHAEIDNRDWQSAFAINKKNTACRPSMQSHERCRNVKLDFACLQFPATFGGNGPAHARQ